MDIQYTIAGTDGQTYGPVTLEQLQTWIREGRVLPETNVLRSDVNTWYPAGQYQELPFPQRAAATATASTAGRTAAQRTSFVVDESLEVPIRRGASWFFTIAVLSAVNTILVLTHADWSFILGLGITQIIDALAADHGGMAIALTLDALVIGILVLFGIMGRKRHSWAFIVGMVLYAGDGLIFLLTQSWLSIAFHAYVLFRLFMGLKACLEYKKQVNG